jgi:hypothetical protein
LFMLKSGYMSPSYWVGRKGVFSGGNQISNHLPIVFLWQSCLCPSCGLLVDISSCKWLDTLTRI